jgi:hypothetical protein
MAMVLATGESGSGVHGPHLGGAAVSGASSGSGSGRGHEPDHGQGFATRILPAGAAARQVGHNGARIARYAPKKSARLP